MCKEVTDLIELALFLAATCFYFWLLHRR